MKVGMYYNNQDVRVEEMDIPSIGDNDILIKVIASGICGSDIMEWYRIKKAPLVLGHELTGTIVEKGKNVTHFDIGDRVFTTHHVPCEACKFCLTGHNTACTTLQTVNNFAPGGFAEFLRVTGKSVETGTLRLPSEMSYEQGSFIEPLGTVLRGLRAIHLTPGESVAIIGTGLAGLLYIKAAKALGAGKVIAIDIDEERLSWAEKFGAEHSINAAENVPEIIAQKNNGYLADKVVLCAGALPAAKTALSSVERGGTVLLFAVPKPGQTIDVDFNPFWRNDVTIKTCYGAAPIDNHQAMEMIRSGNITVDDMITHRLPLDAITRGFQLASEGGSCLKVIIQPHGTIE